MHDPRSIHFGAAAVTDDGDRDEFDDDLFGGGQSEEEATGMFGDGESEDEEKPAPAPEPAPLPAKRAIAWKSAFDDDNGDDSEEDNAAEPAAQNKAAAARANLAALMDSDSEAGSLFD